MQLVANHTNFLNHFTVVNTAVTIATTTPFGVY